MLLEKKINIMNSVLNYIRYKQLNWYDHVQRLEEERFPRKFLEWCLPGRRKRGRPRISWMQEVATGMRDRERRIGSLVWLDSEGWRRKKKKECKRHRKIWKHQEPVNK